MVYMLIQSMDGGILRKKMEKFIDDKTTAILLKEIGNSNMGERRKLRTSIQGSTTY